MVVAGLGLAFAVPGAGAVFGSLLGSFNQDTTQAVAAVEVHADELEADFVDTSAPQQHLAADFLHTHRYFNIGLGSDAEVVIARSHAPAQTHLAHHNVRLSPGTAEARREGARQNDAFIASLPDP